MNALLIHEFFNRLPRLDWRSIDSLEFADGIYVMFEQGEKLGEYDRIVQVGTHTVAGGLQQRLRQHFLREHMPGSILRKNIGRALCGQMEPPRTLEPDVTRYLQAKMRFAACPVDNVPDRLRFRLGLTASLHKDPQFKPGPAWLGLRNPVAKIRENGLWNVQGMNHKPLSPEEWSMVSMRIE